MDFKLVSSFKPTGDQPQAIEKLTDLIKSGSKHQTLLGVTGSGKTFTMGNVIANLNRPTLVISHNKTLAGQLYQELRDFFPENAVCYFVSYYDYYQPEAYIPQSDTYIEKETEVNDEIDKLRLSATANLLSRKDVIVVASVSCIYNIGSPVEFGKFMLELKPGVKIDRQSLMLRLTDLQYSRNDYGFKRSTFRTRGDSIDLFPAYSDNGIRIELKNNIINKISEFSPLTGDIIAELGVAVIYPAKHFMTSPDNYDSVFANIRKDLAIRIKKLKDEDRILEAKRIEQRTNYDLQMIRELGYVNGIENYSRYFDGRKPGDPPYSLINYFQQSDPNFLTIVDESHITIPQIRGMYNGDQARKKMLIDYGFRLPSALDNRPLRFDEFMQKVNQITYVSATPNDFELSLSIENNAVVEQLIRPTGLIDPKIIVKPTKGQIEDLIVEILKRVKKNQRVLITTLTKRMSEDLSNYLAERDIKVSYLHSDVHTLDRQDVLDKFREAKYDVLIGINLLREGLDIPEVSLVAILDADKEGFLRSKTALIQTMGRAARNVDSEVIMYAEVVTKSMESAISEVKRRRKIQLRYNVDHNITPTTIQKEIRKRLVEREIKDDSIDFMLELSKKDVVLPDEIEKIIKKLTLEMRQAAKELDFGTAMLLRDHIRNLKSR
ncbi:MAG: excinuclease ABC subunit B [Candidatus Levybacteria bacterium CG_4_9_14_3_um_filter_35_16]|nr:MAG: excinuclease ABC subunit B [Candidatus Levybacteria bacterium CG22_combo_CG10-13_8_21_14_all_35_11]PIY95031.1 MAG: excinuclease ABC subunit B [Candidatus Levybacteria bacterium CG_4_10_14_0_8_um_filter_35_23]PJA91335.1 MAG: excinuclease ABC subunit B [Candidatus Levybacteria bacterium CG_4_9_14_3_um_filter_35_16]PJC54816.1 MAG: excinuclease ABC subunit B [Candidatus Levybacteria bacterium CG_4_9_14_0_2_um_filter_35_21]